jgi:two-component system chemotaxis response regulator CheB
LRTILEHDPLIEVVGEAADGREALAQVAALRPDVITMDVRMPIMDGLETTERIMAHHPTPILVVTASLSRYDVDITFRMLGAGALDVVEKPRLHDLTGYSPPGQQIVRRLKAIASMKVVTHLRGRRHSAQAHEGAATAPEYAPDSEPGAPPDPSPAPLARHIDTPVQPLPLQLSPSQPTTTGSRAPFPLVVIGASAGGPRIIYQILARLPHSFAAAVLIVQHIADGFARGMAEWFASAGTISVHLAQDRMPIDAGTALVAPDGYDLLVGNDGLVRLDNSPLQEKRSRPSIDLTMQSAAQVFGSATMGIILTGMGSDGAQGMQHIRRAGGYTYAQDAASAPIYGMPRAAAELGAVDAVMAPEEMGIAVQRRVELFWSQRAQQGDTADQRKG